MPNNNYLQSYLDLLGGQNQYQGINPQIANFIQSMKARSPQALATQSSQAGGEGASPVDMLNQINNLGNTYLDMQNKQAETQMFKRQAGGQIDPTSIGAAGSQATPRMTMPEYQQGIQQGSIQPQYGSVSTGLGAAGIGPPEAVPSNVSLQATPSFGADVGIDVGTPIYGQSSIDLGTSLQNLGQAGQTAPQATSQAGQLGSQLGGTISDAAAGVYGGLGQTAANVGQYAGQAASAAGKGISEIASVVMSMMSDEDVKKNKKKSDKNLDAFLDALNAYQFEYKNEKHGKGKKYGVMAQDLEKTKVGKAMVEEGEEGKMIDMASGLGTTMAALGYINDRLKKLENSKNG